MIIHEFSVWLRTSNNPADINRFLSHTGKYFDLNIYYLCYNVLLNGETRKKTIDQIFFLKLT